MSSLHDLLTEMATADPSGLDPTDFRWLHLWIERAKALLSTPGAAADRAREALGRVDAIGKGPGLSPHGAACCCPDCNAEWARGRRFQEYPPIAIEQDVPTLATDLLAALADNARLTAERENVMQEAAEHFRMAERYKQDRDAARAELAGARALLRNRSPEGSIDDIAQPDWRAWHFHLESCRGGCRRAQKCIEGQRLYQRAQEVAPIPAPEPPPQSFVAPEVSEPPGRVPWTLGVQSSGPMYSANIPDPAAAQQELERTASLVPADLHYMVSLIAEAQAFCNAETVAAAIAAAKEAGLWNTSPPGHCDGLCCVIARGGPCDKCGYEWSRMADPLTINLTPLAIALTEAARLVEG